MPITDANGRDSGASGSMVTRDLTIDGELMRVCMEHDFWVALHMLADDGMVTVETLCQRASRDKPSPSLASSLRLMVLHHYAFELRVRQASTLRVVR